MASHDASAPTDSTGDLPSETPVTADFKAAFRNHPAGVAIITADDGSGPSGLTATSVISVSAEPALLAFSLSSSSSATPLIARADTVVVHLLGSDQLELARRFATGGIDRFADTGSWTRLATGEPLLAGVDSWLRGRTVDRVEAGSATVVIVRVLHVQAGRHLDSPLVYRNRTWYALDEAAVLA
ncbi:flavin reductase (DIM6/NTAB) family NADH-FMN oxidoreductase RutF [Halopolyspora algeriensis]|uniref:Flavin reductase (DIM6/NTAB) family NADH-FMN oxidoreductase RutF n=1 Tax=Halopolyspora algeriensis TaxID=1500506 RepID=A0A368VWP6_9ACTN|nr:flavin reductase family protein [Halopolyspora algeriensis]RCW45727.1 flavin reductase (DIM6/NTAB) family NADH-FMN oxidoreductase RutF [Halopolyspora algeriensis]TQM54111.1 flavin reductase (DIM6/NTAB) family NADH-FMN oxidoreductase RutF [Halopolyspora algeriensis]